MTSYKISNLYIGVAFQQESILNRSISKRPIDRDLADRTKWIFYDTLDVENYGHRKRLTIIQKSYVIIYEVWPVRIWCR